MNQHTTYLKQGDVFDQNVQLAYDEKDLLEYMHRQRLDLLNESSIMSIGSREDFLYPWFVQHNISQHPKFVEVEHPIMKLSIQVKELYLVELEQECAYLPRPLHIAMVPRSMF